MYEVDIPDFTKLRSGDEVLALGTALREQYEKEIAYYQKELDIALDGKRELRYELDAIRAALEIAENKLEEMMVETLTTSIRMSSQRESCHHRITLMDEENDYLKERVQSLEYSFGEVTKAHNKLMELGTADQNLRDKLVKAEAELLSMRKAANRCVEKIQQEDAE